MNWYVICDKCEANAPTLGFWFHCCECDAWFKAIMGHDCERKAE